MAECETSEETSNPAVGIVLVLLACCCYAFGNCLQRYSLLRQPDEKVWGILNRHAGWTVGAIIYFSANGIYSVALSFAPVSVLAAVFSLTIVANATCAKIFLGDSIPRLAYPGYVMVLAGSIVFSVTLNAEVCHFDGSELIEVMTTYSAIVFWLLLGIIMMGGAIFAWRFEKGHPLVDEDEEVMKKTEAETGDVVTTDESGDGVGGGAGEATSGYVLHKDDDDVEQQRKPDTEQQQKQHDTNKSPTRRSSSMSEKEEQMADLASPLSGDDEEEMEEMASTSSFPERKDQNESEDDGMDPRSLLLARFVYPSSLGATEAVGALILKAVNSLFTTIATEDEEEENDEYFNPNSDEDYPDDLGLWIALFVVGFFLFLGIVLWLRLVYSRFEITGAFPVEFGMLTLASVVGGFAVFQDYKFIKTWQEWFGIGIAGFCILGGIGLVGYASWKSKVEQEEESTTTNNETTTVPLHSAGVVETN